MSQNQPRMTWRGNKLISRRFDPRFRYRACGSIIWTSHTLLSRWLAAVWFPGLKG